MSARVSWEQALKDPRFAVIAGTASAPLRLRRSGTEVTTWRRVGEEWRGLKTDFEMEEGT